MYCVKEIAFHDLWKLCWRQQNSKLCNSSRKRCVNLNFSTKTHNNNVQNMLNDQLYQFYNLDFRIFMTSHENDLYNKCILKIIFVIYTRCQQIDVFQSKVNSSVREIYILRPSQKDILKYIFLFFLCCVTCSQNWRLLIISIFSQLCEIFIFRYVSRIPKYT